jgi:hypothetical protein
MLDSSEVTRLNINYTTGNLCLVSDPAMEFLLLTLFNVLNVVSLSTAAFAAGP